MNPLACMKRTPRTRQSMLTLAAFRPWGSSHDGRRAGPVAQSRGYPSSAHDALTATTVRVRARRPPRPRYQQLWLVAELAVASSAEDSPSGLWRTIGNRVGCYSPRGFKSRILRHRPAPTPVTMMVR
jgi:hypothetical protein